MRVLAKLASVELKLFIREPISLVFTFALPLIFLFVMGGVFGNVPNPDVYSGVGPMDYYTPAYIGLVLTAIGVVSLPTHITGYRERGILRRLRASSLSVWHVLGAQIVVSFVIAVIGGIILSAVALGAYDTEPPRQPLLLLGAFVLGGLSFTTLGFLLGAVLPTTRAAQGLGLILFFIMLILGGGGPPREVMTDAMKLISDLTPTHYVILVLQDPWTGSGWNVASSLVLVGITVVSALLAVRSLKWE